MSYSEAKTTLRNNFRREWRQQLDIGTEEDSIHQLDRAAQVTLVRLRTGHFQLLFLLHRLKISHSDECPCGTWSHPPPSPLPQPHPAVLPHLRRQDTADLAWPGTQKKARINWSSYRHKRRLGHFEMLNGSSFNPSKCTQSSRLVRRIAVLATQLFVCLLVA